MGGGSPCFEDGRARAPPPQTLTTRTLASEGARSCTTEACLEVSRSTPAVRAAERRSKRGRAVNRRPLRSLRFQRTPRVARLPARDRPVGSRRERRDLTSPTPAPQVWSSAPWVPTPRTVPRWRARLEEPPKPSRPLSVAVAPKAPVRAFPLLRKPAAPRAVRLARHSPSRPEPRTTPLV